MNNGYIYCVSTPANTDRCKVGETLKGIEDRLKGLNTTSVSENFKLDYYIIVDPIYRFKIEKSIHNDIITAGYTRFPGKEFFKCKPDDIKQIFEKYGDIHTTINKQNDIELINKFNGIKHRTINKQNNIDLIDKSNENINILLPKLHKKYKCDTCKKEFNIKRLYNNHLSRKNPCKSNNINQCNNCNKIYSTPSNLNKHVKLCVNKLIIDNEQLQINELKIMILEHQKKVDNLYFSDKISKKPENC